MKEKIKRLLKISVIKSLLFNKAYFGWGGLALLRIDFTRCEIISIKRGNRQ